ncbi:putative U2 small nuclear ribonucleoprotein A' [Spironucleus salmonicida]|uniref:Leucine-rich repeat-containing protein 51 n=1 Tax=Spironucleus salmonicida TaxID=348837 RepID=V6LY30_9EUKA|nr:putative U2 small nuclear ribonucleoprotein A' [Spironucleus salmonicida]|eukprot:EST45689.1 Putative U2 small nuclear ribonucleoprotein A' [Spironucleus salmonicida]
MLVIDFQNIDVKELPELLPEDSNCQKRKPTDYQDNIPEQYHAKQFGLNLRSCNIQSLFGLGQLVFETVWVPDNLVYLDVSSNQLTSMKGVEECPNLKIFYAQGNNISDINEVQLLLQLRELQSIKLHGNPIILLSNFRQYLIETLPWLKNIDSVPVTSNDKVWADYNKSLGNIDLKKRNNVVLRK